jgi:hypothetical protein
MTILRGLGTALLGAVAIACGVLGLSNLYVGQWGMAGGLLGCGLGIGVLFAWGWGTFLDEIGAVETEVAGETAVAAPRAPALLASFWLIVLAGVLTYGAFSVEGSSRWLSAGTAFCLFVVGATIAFLRAKH